MLVARLEIGNRALETVEDSRPKFHTVQVRPQPLERFDQISYDRIGRLFRHSYLLVGRFLRAVKDLGWGLVPRPIVAKCEYPHLLGRNWVRYPTSAILSARFQFSRFDFDDGRIRGHLMK